MNSRIKKELKIIGKLLPDILSQLLAIDGLTCRIHNESLPRRNLLAPYRKEQWKFAMLLKEVLRKVATNSSDVKSNAAYINAVMAESERVTAYVNAAKPLLTLAENLTFENALASFEQFMLEKIADFCKMKSLSPSTKQILSTFLSGKIDSYKSKNIVAAINREIIGFKNSARQQDESLDGLEDYLNANGVSANIAASAENSVLISLLLSPDDVESSITEFNEALDVISNPVASLASAGELTVEITLNEIKRRLIEAANSTSVSKSSCAKFAPAHDKKTTHKDNHVVRAVIQSFG